METRTVVGILLVVLAVISAGVFVYALFGNRRKVDLRSLMNKQGGGFNSPPQYGDLPGDNKKLSPEEEFERLNRVAKVAARKKAPVTLEERYFRAGLFSVEDRRDFQRIRVLAPIFLIPLGGISCYIFTGPDIALVGMLLGAGISYQIPISILDRRAKARNEDILFYLPLVIEQISIGVSSSLDIGPCIQRVVSMADERDSHNVVTELLKTVQFYIKSGVSLEDALTEVGKLSGNVELKHAFMSLAQVAKHGGEITRQLQELADAVATQRDTQIDAKIKKLELVATGPVALVFFGFLIILLIGFGLQVMKGF
jgi:Flp pilus assembly protein TadB